MEKRKKRKKLTLQILKVAPFTSHAQTFDFLDKEFNLSNLECWLEE